MCFRPSTADTIEHRCPACGTNNLPEATMCANCFAPMEPLTADNLQPAAATGAPSAPAAPMAPSAPAAPAAPAAPSASGFGTGAHEGPAVGEVISF